MERIGLTHWRDGNNNISTIDNDTRINHDVYANDHQDELDDAGGNITGKTDDSHDCLVNPGLYDLDNDLMYPNFRDLDIDMGNIEANNNNGNRRSESQDSIDKLPLRTNNHTLSVDGVANTSGIPLSNDNSGNVSDNRNNDSYNENNNDGIDEAVRAPMMTNRKY